MQAAQTAAGISAQHTYVGNLRGQVERQDGGRRHGCGLHRQTEGPHDFQQRPPAVANDSAAAQAVAAFAAAGANVAHVLVAGLAVVARAAQAGIV